MAKTSTVSSRDRDPGPLYEVRDVAGVKCVVWKFKESDSPNLRRKAKDEFGQKHLDFPMLDLRMGEKGHPEFCDIIMITADCSKWESDLKILYPSSSYNCSTRQYKKSHQMTWKNGDEPVISVTFYPDKSKLMIQPGRQDELQLVDFLSKAKSLISSTSIPAHSQLGTHGEKQTLPMVYPPKGRQPTDNSNQKAASDEAAKNAGSPTEHPTINRGQASADSTGQKSTNAGDTSHVSQQSSQSGYINSALDHVGFLPAEKLVVQIQPILNDPNADLVSLTELRVDIDNSDYSESGNENEVKEDIADDSETVKEKNTHVNEMLCFIQYKMRTLGTDLIVKVCKEFYSSEDITKGKDHLYTVTEPVRNSRQRHVKRRPGPDSSSSDLMDILKLLHSLELEDIPIYVTKDLGNLPPLGAYDNDVLSLRREMDDMKNSIQLFKDTHSEIKDLSRALKLLASKQVEGRLQVSEPTISQPLKETVDEPNTSSGMESDGYSAGAEDSEAEVEAPTESLQAPEEAHGTVNPKPKMQTRMYYSQVLVQARDNGQGLHRNRNQVKQKYNDPLAVGQPKKHSHKNNNDVSNKASRGGVIVGRGQSTTIRASNHKPSNSKTPNPNRQCIGVFVTRLMPKISVKQIEQFIHVSTGLKVSPEKLETRYNSYASFFIRAEHKVRRVLLDADLWPAGAMLKPFYQ